MTNLAEIERLRELVERAKNPHDDLARLALANAVPDLLDTLEGTRKALRKFGRHRLRCATMKPLGECTCGFEAALGEETHERTTA